MLFRFGFLASNTSLEQVTDAAPIDQATKNQEQGTKNKEQGTTNQEQIQFRRRGVALTYQ
jgi:hypothetical protein